MSDCWRLLHLAPTFTTCGLLAAGTNQCGPPRLIFRQMWMRAPKSEWKDIDVYCAPSIGTTLSLSWESLPNFPHCINLFNGTLLNGYYRTNEAKPRKNVTLLAWAANRRFDVLCLNLLRLERLTPNYIGARTRSL